MTTAAREHIWTEMTGAALRGMTPEAARAILKLKFRPTQLKRLHALSADSKRGRLVADGHAELEFYLQLGHLLTLLHSRARVALKRDDRRPGRRKSA